MIAESPSHHASPQPAPALQNAVWDEVTVRLTNAIVIPATNGPAFFGMLEQ
jgi:hypothetical protein